MRSLHQGGQVKRLFLPVRFPEPAQVLDIPLRPPDGGIAQVQHRESALLRVLQDVLQHLPVDGGDWEVWGLSQDTNITGKDKAALLALELAARIG